MTRSTTTTDVEKFASEAQGLLETPFSERRMGVLEQMGKELIALGRRRGANDVISLGFWLRKARLIELEEEFTRRAPMGAAPVSRGLVAHYAPANVDTLFVYSWICSFIMGNVDVVRISERSRAEVQPTIDVIESCLRSAYGDKTPVLFSSWPRESEVNDVIARLASVRVVWGGDATVAAIAAHRGPPGTRFIAFPDRTSCVVLDADQLRPLDDDAFARLAEGGAADVFWYDQAACSSPRFIVWLGSEENVKECAPRWYNMLSEEATRRNLTPATSNVMAKKVYATVAVGSGLASAAKENGNQLVVVSSEPRYLHALLERHCGAGTLIEVQLNAFEELENIFPPNTQTITHGPLSRGGMAALGKIAQRLGIPRVVPIGDALAFDVVWDGHDLLSEFVKWSVIR